MAPTTVPSHNPATSVPSSRRLGPVGPVAAGLLLVVLVGGCGDEPPGEAPSADRLRIDTAPADSMTVARVLRTDDRFSTLTTALDSTGLDSTLHGPGPYTLFAPPNAAFEALPPGTMETLLTERRERLRTILAQHVVPRRVPIGGRSGTEALVALSGDTLRLAATDTATTVQAARVVDGDIETANGLIHVVDRVLRPPSATDGEERP